MKEEKRRDSSRDRRRPTRSLIGRSLRLSGMLLYVAGFALCIASPIVRSAEFGYSGVAAMILGIATAWFGKSIAAGTLESGLREQLNTEASQTLRLQSALSRRVVVWVVVGFTILVLVLIVVYWNLAKNAA